VTSRPASAERYLVCTGLHSYRPLAAIEQLLALVVDKPGASCGALQNALGQQVKGSA
jgi:hypothetical protein